MLLPTASPSMVCAIGTRALSSAKLVLRAMIAWKLDAAFFDDRQPIGGKADRRMTRVRQQDHVVDSERGEDLRSDSIASKCRARLRGLPGPEVGCEAQRSWRRS